MEIQGLYTKLKSSNFLEDNATIKEIHSKKRELDGLIFEAYQVDETEKKLIDYTINVSIPLLKRSDKVFRPLDIDNSIDREYLLQYLEFFLAIIKQNFGEEPSLKVIQSPNYLGVFFKLDSQRDVIYEKVAGLQTIVNNIGDLGFSQISKGLYYQKVVKGWGDNMFYIIKPNEYKSWHPSLALYEEGGFSNVNSYKHLERT